MKKRQITSLLLAVSLLVGGRANAISYTVQPGDTLSGIASRYGTTYQDLAKLNGIADPNKIIAGQTIETDKSLGASIPTVVALYSDALASKISNTATSFTLVRGTDKQSRSLSGYYGFVIDEGTSLEEFLTATCSGTACTISARGIDVQDGKTEVTSLKQEHRRGAEVKITNFPQLAILSRILSGQESASSTFRFGSGNGTDNKYLKADNGTTNLPFLSYNDVTNHWQFSDDGVNTITFATSTNSGLSASSTKGIFITDSLIGVNASSSGLAFDSSGKLYVSPTFSTLGTFSGGLLVTSSSTHTGSTTFTSTVSVPWSSASSSAASSGYLDSKLYGDGSDGALSISSGTTTLNTAGKTVYQYSSVSITGTGGLTFGSNLYGKVIYVLVQGDLTITSTKAPGAVNLTGQGAAAATSFVDAIDGSTHNGGSGVQATNNGGGGGGGAGGANAAGTAGTASGGSSAGAAGASYYIPTSAGVRTLMQFPYVGSGGGNGANGRTAAPATDCTGGAGGEGGGAIVFIVGGNVNISSTFISNGVNGSNGQSSSCSQGGTDGGGGGGGGSGGFFGIFYGGSITNTATFTMNAGSAGSGSTGTNHNGANGGAGAAGTSMVKKITNFVWGI